MSEAVPTLTLESVTEGLLGEMNGWRKPSQKMAAQEALDRLPKTQRGAALEILAEPGVPPVTAVRILENLAAMPAKDRKRTFELYRSDDPQERSLAKSRAANVPPMPPVSLPLLRTAIREARKATVAGRGAVRTDRIEEAIAALFESLDATQEAYQSLRDSESWG